MLIVFSLSCDKVIGIDFGSSSTCAAVFTDGDVKIIKNEFGKYITPSIVSYHNGKVYCGDSAWQIINNKNQNSTLFGIKSSIGKNNESFYFQITDNKKKYNVSIEEVISTLLKNIKNNAETFIGKEIQKAIITVPSYFNEYQCNVIKNAGKYAGFFATKLLNESIAAALTYNFYVNNKNKRKVLIFHLGGYSNDVTLLSAGNSNIKILASEHSSDICGEKITQMIVDYLLIKFEMQTKKAVPVDSYTIFRLTNEVEKAKKVLNSFPITTIAVDKFYNGKSLNERISYLEIEFINKEIYQKCIISVENVLKKANISRHDIDNVILVGGSTKYGKIDAMLLNYFDHAQINSFINPNEVVAYGAAIYGASISNDQNAYKTIRMIPYSFGIKTYKNDISLFIHEKACLPISKTINFDQFVNNQKYFSFDILMFENDDLSSMITIGKLNLTDLKSEKYDIVNIEITFQIDENYTLTVIAKNGNYKEEKIVINIDNKFLEKKNFEQFNKEINEKIQRVKDIYSATKKEIKEIESEYLHNILWFIDDPGERYNILNEKKKQLKDIILQHFKEIFPNIFHKYNKCRDDLSSCKDFINNEFRLSKNSKK